MKRKHKKKLNIKKVLLFIILASAITLFIKTIIPSNKISNFMNMDLTIKSNNTYNIAKQDTNNNYSGKGQEKISDKDGYFSTFTTGEPFKKTYIEYKQNGNASWSKNMYWNNYMENSGCGITAMAIILSGYKKDVTPETLRNKYYPVLDYDSLGDEFYNSYKIEVAGFFYDSVHLSKEYIKNHLLTNRPILICIWNKPSNNRWTTSSHYMVLLASSDDMVYVSNPNGGINDSKSSGWYQYDEITPYIAKAMFIENYE